MSKMRGASDVAVGVPDLHQLAVPAAPPGITDPPLADGHYRRPRRRRVIDGQMGTQHPEYRMSSIQAVARRNSPVTQRRSEKSPLDGQPIQIIVRAFAFLAGVVNGMKGISPRADLGGEHASRRATPVRVANLLKGHREGVAPLEVGEEVDVVLKDRRQVKDLQRCKTGFNTGLVKTLVHAPMNRPCLPDKWGFFQFG